VTRPRPPKPTPRGLEMLRILYAAWERREKVFGNWRGAVTSADVRRRAPGPPARRYAVHSHALRRTLATLAAQGLVRSLGWVGPWQITDAGRRAVERAGGAR
jgi:integrase